MSKDECLAILDIGTAKTVAFILDVGHPLEPRIRGTGLVSTNGLHKNTVMDPEALAVSLRNALDQAEQNAGCRASGILCNQVGTAVKVFINKGTTAIQQKAKGISADDIERVIEASKILPHNTGQELIYAAPRTFFIDESPAQNILGKKGVRLDVETGMVTADRQQLADLANIVNNISAAAMNGWIYPGVAMANSVLTEEERQGQALLIDLGAGTVDVTLVDRQQPVFAFTLPVAGRHITNDLSIGLGIDLDEAEQLKIKCGVACPEILNSRLPEEFDVHRPKTGISPQVIAGIIEARLQEIFLLLEQNIIQSGYKLPSVVILAGGTAMLLGIDKLLTSMWGAKVRVANPPLINGVPLNFYNAAYVSGVAMSILAACWHTQADKTEKNFFGEVFDKFSRFWKAFCGI